jgi:hypothetical protein
MYKYKLRLAVLVAITFAVSFFLLGGIPMLGGCPIGQGMLMGSIGGVLITALMVFLIWLPIPPTRR